jgi:hypothetical protein
MSIAFESSEVQLQKSRERLRLMSDEELGLTCAERGATQIWRTS